MGRIWRRTVSLAAALAATFAVFGVGDAAANEYPVEVCTSRSVVKDGFTFGGEPGSQGFQYDACNLPTTPPRPSGFGLNTALSTEIIGAFDISLNAPAGLTFSSFDAFRHMFGPWSKTPGADEYLGGVLQEPLNQPLEFVDRLRADGPVHWNLAPGQTAIKVRMLCISSTNRFCNGLPNVRGFEFQEVIAQLEDPSLPTVTLGGPVVAGGPISGASQLSVHAADAGSGVSRVVAFLDGKPLGDARGAESCGVPPFRKLAPCGPTLDANFAVDAGALGQGNHTIQVTVNDASGNSDSTSQTFVVDNSPHNTIAPVVSGDQVAGGTLTTSEGGWVGTPASFSFGFQWLSCPEATTTAAGHDACTAIPGATAPQYLAQDADVGKRLIAQVTATNTAGSGVAFSDPTGVVAQRPGGPGGPGGPGEGPGGPPSEAPASLALGKLVTDAKGRSFLLAKVSGPGPVTLTGKKVRPAEVTAQEAEQVHLPVRLKLEAGQAANGVRAKVHAKVTVTFTPRNGTTISATKKLTLPR